MSSDGDVGPPRKLATIVLGLRGLWAVAYAAWVYLR